MKLLIVGDFHGEFPPKIKKIIEKEKIDLVLSNGDYFPFFYRELWFKHCYGNPLQLWEVIGKKKYKSLILKDLRLGERAIKGLNSLKVPVLTVFGNLDHTNYNDQYDLDRYFGKNKPKPNIWDWEEQDFFTPLLKKYSNIERIDYRVVVLGDYAFIGAMGGSSPGMPGSVAFRKHRRKLDMLFKKYRNKYIIFMSHNVPYNTRLDLITSKKAHKEAKGKHFGSKLVRRTIQKWQPLVHIGGHIHEGRGVQRLGRTTCINPGAVHEHEAAISEITNGKIKVKLINL